jgi:hypothetical protein
MNLVEKKMRRLLFYIKYVRRLFLFLLNIFDTHFWTQFLWYARTYYVGVAAQFFYL